jgi:hypothetical protein
MRDEGVKISSIGSHPWDRSPERIALTRDDGSHIEDVLVWDRGGSSLAERLTKALERASMNTGVG